MCVRERGRERGEKKSEGKEKLITNQKTVSIDYLGVRKGSGREIGRAHV